MFDSKSLPFNPKNGNFVEFMGILLVGKHDILLPLNKGCFPKLLLNEQATKLNFIEDLNHIRSLQAIMVSVSRGRRRPHGLSGSQGFDGWQEVNMRLLFIVRPSPGTHTHTHIYNLTE